MYHTGIKIVTLLTVLALLLCAGCQSSTDGTLPSSSKNICDFEFGSDSFTQPPTSTTTPPSTVASPSGPFQLDMTATLIRPQAIQHRTTTLTIKGTYPDAGIHEEVWLQSIDMVMELGKDIGYSFGEMSPSYSYSVLPSGGTGKILHILAVLYDPATNAPTHGYIGLDFENELFILWFASYPGQYIVASTDASRTPEEILEHFAAFIAYYEK